MLVEIIGKNPASMETIPKIDFDSLDCGNFMNSFLTLSATLHRDLTSPKEGLLEIELTNEGNLLIENFNILITSIDGYNQKDNQDAGEYFQIKKKVQEIKPQETLIYSFRLEIGQFNHRSDIQICVKASKKRFPDSRLCIEIPL